MFDMQIKQHLRTTGALSVLALAFLSGCKKAEAPVDDSALTASVQQRLSGDAAISGEPIQVTVQNGAATLNGQVSNAAARTLAANDASMVSGVNKVINNLMVAPPPVAAAVTPEPPKAVPVPVEPKRRAVPKPAARPAAPMQDRQPAPIERAQATPAPAPTPVAPPRPAAPPVRTITLASGSTLPVRITQTLDSATTQTGDTFTGAIASDVIQDGMVVLPRGTPITGHVIEAKDATHFKGSSALSIELTAVNRKGESIALTTEPYVKEGAGRGKNTAIKTGVGAAAGAVLGGIFGGGKGAAIGAAAGGGTGAGINAVTKGQQVQIPSESIIRFRLNNAIAVRTSTVAGANAQDPSLQDHNN